MKGIKQVKNYRLLKEIGRGTTGTVYEAVDDSNGRKIAVKSIPSSKLENKRILENFKRELKLLHSLNHPNIIKITGIEKTVNNTYLALEFCNGGNLFEYLTYYKQKFEIPLPEIQVQFIIRQIISGLEYMHKNKIVHRDIKLENILLNFSTISNMHVPNQDYVKLDYSKHSIFDCTIKIADLGYARELDGCSLASTICGTPMTMAPDVIQFSEKKYNSKADLWSLGAITYELTTSTLPFYGHNLHQLMENVMKGKYSFPNSLKISLEAIVFINGLLQFYPQKRYDWDQILSHPFVVNDTVSFTIIDLEKIEIDSKECEKLQNDTKDCGNFLWILFKTSLKNVTLDKSGLQNILLGEVDGFRKILEINQLKKDENNRHTLIPLEDKNVEFGEKENGNKIHQASMKIVFEDKDPKIEDKIVILDDNHENIEKIDLPAENCCKNNELVEKNRKIEFNIEANGELLQDTKKESEECIKEKLTNKKETIEINRNYLSNGDSQENEELWEILSSTSITEDKIEVINFDESYNIIPDYFNNK